MLRLVLDGPAKGEAPRSAVGWANDLSRAHLPVRRASARRPMFGASAKNLGMCGENRQEFQH